MPRHNNEPCCVYWLYNDCCVCPWRHGYVGISNHVDVRIAAHRRGGKGSSRLVPADFKVQILFTGTTDECLTFEHKLRPHTGIGWNRAHGGAQSCFGFKHSQETRERMSAAAKKSGHSKRPKSIEWRAAMSAAAKARYADPAEHTKTIAAVKNAFIGIDRTGANNPMFGRHMSDETKEKVRAKIKERGGVSGKNNPNYRHGGYT